MSASVHEKLDADSIPGFSQRSWASDASCGRLDKSASHYRMDLHRRGVAVIYDQANCGHKRGFAENDVKSLSKTFEKLGFEVEIFKDLSFCEVECSLEELSQRDHSDCDCFVLAYLSRGSEGKLSARDGCFDVNCLWACFTAEKSPTLANKPKLFIVHAYKQLSRSGRKGELSDLSVDCVVEETPDEEPGSDRLRSYFIPDRADFLIVLSTVQGVTSPSTRPGSLYVQTLCQNLHHHGFSQDMVTILTDVNRQLLNVANSQDTCDSCKRQLPVIISLLIRTLQFTEKRRSSRAKSRTLSWGESSSDEACGEVEERAIVLQNN